MKLIDKYYKRPILYDYLFSFLIIIVLIILNNFGRISLPCNNISADFSSDIGAIGLTVAGFVLTLITILLTLKSGQLLSNDELTEESNPFKIFLSSKLYNKAITILKKGVFSLVFISMLLYILKIGLNILVQDYIFYFNLVGLIIILSTFLRCFYVLTLILKMQN